MQAAATKPRIENRYYQRAAGTARACWVCYKETTTVLATIDKTDFLYTCPSHLADRNFASSLAPPSPGPAASPSKEEIGKVIAEYEAKEKKRKAAGEKDGKAEDDDGAADDDKCKDKGSSKDAAAGALPAYLTPSAPPTPTHNVFALHRDFFAMRLAEQRKRDNLVKAHAVSKELPKAPSNLFPLARPRPTGDGGASV